MNRISIVSNVVKELDKKNILDRIQYFEKNNALVKFRDNDQVLIVPPNDAFTNDIIKKYSEIAKKYHKQQNSFKKNIYTTEAYASIWNEGTSTGPHRDSHKGAEFIIFSTVIYLNDNYEGGEIYFPNQEILIKPHSGDMILFPSGGYEYIHEVRPITHGKRYTIAMWHTQYIHCCPFDMPQLLHSKHRGEHPSF